MTHAKHPHADREHDHHDHDAGTRLSDVELRVRALESVLVEKGYVETATLDALVETYEKKIGPRNGAHVVAKAWSDPVYREWLLADATAAIASLGYPGSQAMVAVANTAEQHNLIVCTLCSCYPWPVLGLPPVWYKSAPYRSRAVLDPRGMLKDFGLDVPAAKRIKVWDSTAEIRYFVLPERPAGTDGMGEAALARLVTRDSMIGVGQPLAPERAAP